MILSIGKNEMQAGLVSILAKLAIAQGAPPGAGGGDASNARGSSLFASLLTDSDDLNKLLVLTLLRALYVSGRPLYKFIYEFLPSPSLMRMSPSLLHSLMNAPTILDAHRFSLYSYVEGLKFVV